MIKLRTSDNQGFTPLYAILIVVVLAIVGIVGWSINHSKHKKINSSTSTSITTPVSPTSSASLPQTAIDPTLTWKVISPSDGGYSIKIPDGWNVIIVNSSIIVVQSSSDLNYRQGSPVTISGQNTGRLSSQSPAFSAWVVKPGQPGADGDFSDNPVAFSLADGTNGTKYSRIQSGVQEYEYRFTKNGATGIVYYRIQQGDTQQVDLIEKVVKTLIID